MSRWTAREMHNIILHHEQVRELVPSVVEIGVNMVLHREKIV